MRKFLYFFILLTSLQIGELFAQISPMKSSEAIVSVYPNPAKDFLYIKTSNPDLKVKSVSFYSILGSTIADMPINASYSEIKVDRLKSGKYLMKYTLSDETQKIIQIIKQ